ncbi:single-stranded-DNA-specific exonuclease RecJ [Anaerovorax odorimutans]|uniref:Single-stranded-DNA-specific exonuclease RecJ n=1 Tax=Anaerovorax odorimutans TaxID=109327 RepID=A0ABT1RSB8_9FIRM|nr:single-stranded-DNA-specific exonuclease RecJ [Anaerovorax odorimutans]MCQ4637766.1 single-stranded-DNA-specific exonuclease RecJ [Anaerovorax odorimutans]
MNYIDPIILELLKKRGISDDAEIKEFLSDKPQKTYDPFLLSDLEAGVDLLLRAIHDKKRICVYGDYDADGITSVSILMEFLGTLTDRLQYYIPSRFDEGYGLNAEAVRKIRAGGSDVLVTVDCGSVSYEEVELAKELGMEVLVTDHHSITDVRADCLLINPKRPDCLYPFRELAGCGVAFKLIQGIQKKADIPRKVLNRALDLVALGTIADVVPLLDENRTLVKHGMHIISSGLRPGLAALIEGISLKRDSLRSDQIAFGVAPHLNAAGRMGDAKIAASLMLEKDKDAVGRQVSQLIDFNKQRKKTQEEAYQLCTQIIDQHLADRNFLVVYAEDVHEGIAGIVAGKLKDKYERPTILVTPSGDHLKGTGRSVSGVNLYEVLKSHEDLFLRFGGHEGACGFSMEQDKLDTLEDLLEQDMKRMLQEDPELFSRQINADLPLAVGDITLELAQGLELLAPFGSKNPKPFFLLENVRAARLQPMGADGKHIRFFAISEDGQSLECVLFNRAKDFESALYGEKSINLIGSVDFQEWRGNKRVQFNVESVV